MEKIIPFKDASEAIGSLDNGGRFYNVFTRPHDDKISLAEVSKVAGLFLGKQKEVLYLELALTGLSEADKAAIQQKFDADLADSFAKFKALHLSPAEVSTRGIVSSNIILRGIPKLVSSGSRLKGFILVPAGPAFTMIPVSEIYDTYEISDGTSAAQFLIVTEKDKDKLPEQLITVGGILKESRDSDDAPADLFLEVSYYVA